MGDTITIEVFNFNKILEDLVGQYGTQAAVAILLNIDTGALSAMKNGYRRPTDELLARLGLKRVEIIVKEDAEV